VKCHGCGVEKDQTVLEVYPWAAEDEMSDEPLPPIFEKYHCQPYEFGKGHQWKSVDMCHACFHKLLPDMWIDRRGWEAINPVTPFDQLPDLESKK
jgi:hypothetical protein